MTTPVFVVLRNVPYEFGTVTGVFISREAAIAHALTLNQDEEITVTRWAPADRIEDQDEQEVWSVFRGKVTESPQ